MKYCLHLALLAFFVMGAGCGEDKRTAPEVSLAFDHLGSARSLHVHEPGTRVFRYSSEWEDFWSSYSQSPVPSVDFNESMLIGVFWGGGYSGCYQLVESIEEIVVRSNRIEIYVGALPDLGDCLAIAYPVDVVVLDRSQLRVSFKGEVPR